MAVERTADQIARDAGFRDGALWAAALARDVLKGMAPQGEPGGFNGRSYRSAVVALQALASGIEQQIAGGTSAPLPEPMRPPLTPMLDIASALAKAKVAESRPAFVAAPAAEGMSSLPARISDAIAKGYTGDECQDCGSFSMVRNGTCLKCENCGSTTGCS